MMSRMLSQCFGGILLLILVSREESSRVFDSTTTTMHYKEITSVRIVVEGDGRIAMVYFGLERTKLPQSDAVVISVGNTVYTAALAESSVPPSLHLYSDSFLPCPPVTVLQCCSSTICSLPKTVGSKNISYTAYALGACLQTV